MGASNPIALRVRLQAPAQVGAWTFKVSLAAMTGTTWQIQQPAGVSDFSQITIPPFAQITTVVVDAFRGTSLYVDASNGLPLYNTSGWGGIAFADVRRDGRDDLACIARLGTGPRFFRSEAGGSWTEASAGLPGSSGRSDVAFGDFNRDGQVDLADGNGKAWLGNGGTSWTLATTGITIRGGPEGVAVGDVNRDGFDDVAFSGHFSPDLQCFLSNGDGTWRESSNGLPNTGPPGAPVQGGHKLLIKDLNDDGFADICWTRYYAPGVWLGDGQGNWTQAAGAAFTPSQFWGVDAADLDGDGDQDLVFGVFDLGNGQGGGGIRVYENLGSATWTQRGGTNLPQAGMYHDVAIADFDRDGTFDLVAGLRGTARGGVEVWRGTGSLTWAYDLFADVPSSGIGYPEGIAVGDVNGDTFPDIGIAAYGMGVQVFVNTRTGFSRYGAGCGPVIGPAGGQPQIGNLAFGWTVANAPGSAPAWLALGLSHALLFGAPVLPLDLGPSGAPGCFLRAEPLVLIPGATQPNGTATIGTPIPLAQPLVGVTVFGQWLVLSPPANPLGVLLSDGGAARIGP
jgi:hypothetical protein